ncbi:MAG: isoaspartyl peptidase/L-asparaginase family protein [Wenzhouxiangella sp.]
MKPTRVLLLLPLLGLAVAMTMTELHASERPIAIAVHGGAGTIERGQMSEEREASIRAALTAAVEAGQSILAEGGSSLDAVTAAVRILEDAPEFNAGRGAVLTAEGRVELDASIMVGNTLDAGAIASVRGVRHPIDAARRVMEDSPHVMLVGQGAEQFAEAAGLEFKDEDWFITDFRAEQLRAIQESQSHGDTQLSESWFSTVGAVAIDRHGDLAAATSTGGMSNKRFGRVGDSPIIGAGTYADNQSCAVSATGHGEYFIRHVVAYDICARMRYSGLSLEESADIVVNQVLREAGGDGGVIAIDNQGRVAMPFNTAGMYRAAIHADGRLEVGIYGDEDD